MTSPKKKTDIRSFFGAKGGLKKPSAATPPPVARDGDAGGVVVADDSRGIIEVEDDEKPSPRDGAAGSKKRPKSTPKPSPASKRSKGTAGGTGGTDAGAAPPPPPPSAAVSLVVAAARAAKVRAEVEDLWEGPPPDAEAGSRARASAKADGKKRAPAAEAASAPSAAPPATKKAKEAAAAAAPAAAYEAPRADEARAAVLAAAEELPPPEELDYSLMDDSSAAAAVGAGRPDDAPPNAGVVPPPPPGHPDAFKGLTFVISGVLDSLHRDEAASHIQRHGGRVTGSVSGKTNFLVVGHRAGRSKTSAALSRRSSGCRMIDERGLRALIEASVPFKPEEVGEEMEDEEETEKVEEKETAATAAPQRPVPSAPPATATTASAPPGSAPPVTGHRGTELWVDKHRPRRSSELVGNPGAIATLRQWLVIWDDVHLHGNPPPTKSTGPGANKDLTKKAVLLSGPPGVGKTSAALAVARECGFVPIEVNASDSRGKADSDVKGGIAGKLSNVLRELATNRTLAGCGGSSAGGFFGSSSTAAAATTGKGKARASSSAPPPSNQRERVCIIMDEVDGMSAGDRGGVSELVSVIKASKVPVIAIANDKWSQKLKPLRGASLELDFRKPDARTVAKRLAAVCAAEGLQASEGTLIALAEGANCDVRSVVGQLQLVRLRKRALSFDEAASGGKFSVSKDATVSPFEASRWLFTSEASRSSINSRLDAALVDGDLVPLLVQENYVSYNPAFSQGKPEAVRLRLVARAADGISIGDVLGRRVRVGQAWSLMPAAAAMQSVFPSSYVRGTFGTLGAHPGEQNFPRFTAWLGCNSSQGKQRRLLSELGSRISSSEAGHGVAADRAALRCDYVPALARTLTRPLASLGAGGRPGGAPPVVGEEGGEGGGDPVSRVVAEMAEYQLTKDDFDFLLSVTKFRTRGEWGVDPYKGVPAAKKAAFTRALTSGAAPTRWNKDAGGFSRVGKKGKASKGSGGKQQRASTPGDDDETGGDDEEEEEEQFGGGGSRRSPSTKVEESDEADALLDEEAKAAKAAARLAKRGIVFEAKGGEGGKGGVGGASKGATKGKGKAKK